MENEFQDALAMNTAIGTATRKVYGYHYNRLMRLTDNEKLLPMSEDRLISVINNDDIPPQSANGMLSVILLIRRANGLPVDKLVKYRETTLYDAKIAHKRIQNIKLKDELPNTEDINKYIRYLYNTKDYVGYIINYLMIRYATRNKDLNIIITRNPDVVKKKDDSNVNYLYITRSYVTYIRNDFKTISTYGKKKHRIDNALFNKAVTALLGDEYETPLLQLNDGEPISEESLAKVIQRKTYNSIGEGKYFKVQIQDLKSQRNIKRIKELANSRGTDLQVVFNQYDIDN